MVLRFGEFTLDPDAGILQRDGTRIPLEPQPARLLAILAARPGQLVTRDELATRLWGPDIHVDYGEGLSYCVRRARLALGDAARRPRYIETLPRRGYRFVAEVGRVQPVTRHARRLRLGVALGLAAGLAALVALVERRPNDHHETALRALQSIHDLIWGE